MERSVASIVALAALLSMPASSLAQDSAAPLPREVRSAPPTVLLGQADLKALREVQQESQRRVSALAAPLATTPPGPSRAALERRVAQAKLEAQVDYLNALAGWARAHGRPALAAQAEGSARQLMLLTLPASPVAGAPREKTVAPKEVRP